MLFMRSELDQLQTPRIEINEEFVFDQNLIKEHPRCTEIRDIFVVGHIYYDHHSSQTIVDLTINGIMVVPCAISLRPVELDLDIRLEEMFSFEAIETEGEGIYVEGEALDLRPYLIGSILADVPLAVVHPDIKEYPKGDGWEVLTEEDYIKQKSQEIDPRLAKLKDFKFE
ncbi:MAG: DUF177 domain-containing protein [Erysipelothrix sp.]|nr:DUF177 domain-containing protein [Erysipelothrix sp.]